MSGPSLAPPTETFPLRGGRRALSLHATGFRHAASWLAGGERFTGYDEITDVSAGPRGLRVGSLRNVLLLPRRIFLDAAGPDRLAAALVARIARQPGGELQLARMAAVEQLALRGASRRPWATLAALTACFTLFAAGLYLGPAVHDAGHFGATLFRAGEYWRLLTANLLHAGLPHLAINSLGLWVLGELVERPLGSARTVLVMAASALGAMGAGIAAGYEEVVGASGIVCGLAGAVLCLELRVPDRLPAVWRVPRRLLAVAIGADALLSVFLPGVAGLAHAGGFAAGGLVGLALVPRAPDTAPVPGWVRATAVATTAVCALGALVLVREVVGGPAVLARRAERLLDVPGVSPTILNNTAWMIVTAPKPTAEQIQLALRSAQRAVAQTERSDPNLLDTLAESQFLAGRSEEAVETIDEAIALAPGETYFVEQRRRFLGERDYDDRPAPPEESVPSGEPDGAPFERRRPLPPGHPPVDEDSPAISV